MVMAVPGGECRVADHPAEIAGTRGVRRIKSSRFDDGVTS